MQRSEFEQRRAQLAFRSSTEEATADRAGAKRKRREDAGDYLAGAEGANLARLHFGALVQHFKGLLRPPEEAKRLTDLRNAPAGLKILLRLMGAEETAGVAFGSLSQAIFELRGDERSPAQTIKFRVGEALRRKFDEHRLLKKYPRTHGYLERKGRQRRDQKARDAAFDKWSAKAGFRASKWSEPQTVRAGEWLIEHCIQGLPHVFMWEDGVPCFREEALHIASHLIIATAQFRPVLHPQNKPTKPWTGWRRGAWWHDSKHSFAFVNDDRAEADIKAAFADGSIRPHADGVSAAQSVEWQINPEIVDAIERHGMEMLARKIERKPYEGDRKFQRRIEQAHLRAVIDTASAYRLWRFRTPIRCDTRGRLYPLTHFNRGTREDHVRAAFRFARGKPIGREGLFWLRVHVANTGDFRDELGRRISKLSFADHAAWTEKNLDKILAAPETLWWKQAEEPFQFLAAALELGEALKCERPEEFETHLPINLDCTCSGLQHLSAMIRSEAGEKVNLTPSAVPRDIYEDVAAGMRGLVEADSHAKETLVGLEIDRRLVKRPTMTFFYSAKNFKKQFRKEMAAYIKGDTDQIDKSRHGGYYEAMRGVAPNLVHALDASHAALTINACAVEGIELTTCHDCFSMLACDADRFNQIVREQFVKMYEQHDVLKEIFDSAEKAGAVNLPPIPGRGKLNIRAVLEAGYFVS